MSDRPPGLAPVIARIGPVPEERKSLPMLPWYPASFMSSTRGWSLAARGIYRELLDSQWDMGGIPAEPTKLQRLIGATTSEWRSWSIVEPKFPIGPDGVRRNPTLEKHRIRAFSLAEKHRLGAQMTNDGRWPSRKSKTRGKSKMHEGGAHDAS